MRPKQTTIVRRCATSRVALAAVLSTITAACGMSEGQTLIRLVLIPTLYLSANHGLERVRGWTSRRLGRESSMPEPAN